MLAGGRRQEAVGRRQLAVANKQFTP